MPLAQTRFVDGRLLVPYSKDDLTLAPHHDPDEPLTVEQEQTLFAHYNVGYSDADAPGPHTGVEANQTGLTGSPDAVPTRSTSPRCMYWRPLPTAIQIGTFTWSSTNRPSTLPSFSPSWLVTSTPSKRR